MLSSLWATESFFLAAGGLKILVKKEIVGQRITQKKKVNIWGVIVQYTPALLLKIQYFPEETRSDDPDQS